MEQAPERNGAADLAAKFAELESLVKPYMSPDALSRYHNLRIAHQELCISAMVYLAKMVQSGHLKQVDDKTFKLVLMRLQEGKKQFTFR